MIDKVFEIILIATFFLGMVYLFCFEKNEDTFWAEMIELIVCWGVLFLAFLLLIKA